MVPVAEEHVPAVDDGPANQRNGWATARDLLNGVQPGTLRRESMRNRTGVLIADDNARSRKGLRALLTTCLEVDVVGEATDGREAVQLVGERRPSVVVMDAQMPAMDGLTATRAIKEQWPEVRVVVLTMYGSYRIEALSAGADAFLVKGCLPETLLAAILNR